MKSRMIGSLIALTVCLTACGGGDGTKAVSPDELTASQVRARSNAFANLLEFREDYPSFAESGEWGPYMGIDETQALDCPQGDGWIKVTFLKSPSDGTQRTVYCSTYSPVEGCLPEADYIKQGLNRQAGHCQPSVPYPLPVLTK